MITCRDHCSPKTRRSQHNVLHSIAIFERPSQLELVDVISNIFDGNIECHRHQATGIHSIHLIIAVSHSMFGYMFLFVYQLCLQFVTCILKIKLTANFHARTSWGNRGHSVPQLEIVLNQIIRINFIVFSLKNILWINIYKQDNILSSGKFNGQENILQISP